MLNKSTFHLCTTIRPSHLPQCLRQASAGFQTAGPRGCEKTTKGGYQEDTHIITR